MTNVFKFDGTLKCGFGDKVPFNKMQEELLTLRAIGLSPSYRTSPKHRRKIDV